MGGSHIEWRAFAGGGRLAQDGGDRLEQVGEEIGPVFRTHQRTEMAVRRFTQSDERVSPLQPRGNERTESFPFRAVEIGRSGKGVDRRRIVEAIDPALRIEAQNHRIGDVERQSAS